MWEKVKLNDICNINIGKTPSRNNSAYWGGENKWISISDLKGCRYIDATKETISDLGVKESGIKSIPPNTLIYSFKLSIGKTAITRDFIYSNEAIASLPIIDPNRVSLGYLYWAIQTLRLDSVGDKAVMGITLNKAKLKELEIPLPPLPIQEKIATILDKADELRRKDKDLQAKYDELAQAIFIDMFGDPVKNEKSWEVKRLEEFADVGSSRRVFVNELIGDGIPFYRGTEVGALGEGKSINPTLFISPEHFLRLKKEVGVPKIGDLLLPSICPDGRIWEVTDNKEFYFKDGRVLWIRVDKKQINSCFLKNVLKVIFAKEYNKIASGTTFAELKIFALKSLESIVPPIHLQEAFAKKIEIINHLKAQTNADKSEELFQSLLQKAFKGELVK